MGRSLSTQTDLFNSIESKLNSYRNILRLQDKEAFDNIMAHARKHLPSASEAAHFYPLEIMLLAISLEQEKGSYRLLDKIDELLNLYESIEERLIKLEVILKDFQEE
jgi:hypothetical protein